MTEEHEDEMSPDAPEAPEFTADAPGFDMLADADEDNAVEAIAEAPSTVETSGPAVKTDETHAPATASYQVLARKYRPRNFDDLIGQEAMVQTLTNAFESGRIAHGFMLTGVRGVGKTTTARILARALNYQTDTANAPSMDLHEEGAHCSAIMDGTHVDVLEMDAASRTGIGDIREIIDNVRYMPSTARYKVYIIDEVHMLSKAAFNGLLKTLEEPPEHVKFIFATTEIRQVPVTILSRCQRFDLRRLTVADTEKLLTRTCAAENVSLPADTVKLIAKAADGSARDGLSLLDRALAHIEPSDGGGAGHLDENTMRGLLGLADRGRVFDLFDLLMRGQLADALAEFETQYNMGADPAAILSDLAELTHWLTRMKFVPEAQQDIGYSENLRQRGADAAEKLSTRILSRVWQVLLVGHDEVARAANAKAAADMVLIRLAHLSDLPTPEELVKQYETAPPAVSSAAPGSSSASGTMSAPASSDPVSQAPVSGSGGANGPSRGGPEPGRSNFDAPKGSAAPAPIAAISAPVLQNFQAVVDLAADKRDIGLKHALENGVHLVGFEAAAGERAGRIELRLAEGQANMAQELTRKLRDWTGQSWVVSLSQETGAPTIGSLKMSEAERREEAARHDPHVKAALTAFPQAEIVSISEFEADAPSELAPDIEPLDDEMDD